MTFKNFCKTAINYVKSNMGKTLLVSHVSAFMAYDSFVFRTQTSPYIYSKNPKTPEKYDSDSLYSTIMIPVREIKDYFWINSIHYGLLKSSYGKDDIEITRDQYSNFLKHYPYPEKRMKDIRKGLFYPSTTWIVKEFYHEEEEKRFNYFGRGHRYSDRQLELLQIFEKYDHYRNHPTFVKYLLKKQLELDTFDQDYKIINWCLAMAIKNYDSNILTFSEEDQEHMHDLPKYFCNPDNIIIPWIHDWNSKTNQNIVLCSSKKYFQNMMKHHPNYFEKWVDNWMADGRSTNYPLCPITILSKSATDESFRKFLLDNYDNFSVKVKQIIAFACFFEMYNLYDNIDPKIKNFLKDEKNLIEFLESRVANMYKHRITVESLRKIVDSQYVLNKLILEGHYQLQGDSEINDEILSKFLQTYAETLLKTQHNLGNKTVRTLLIAYEKRNFNMTKTELDHFIKTYQPKYFKSIYGTHQQRSW
uniref:Uncharacterized protein n=1 Tax=viral metagenome TaxID=1070528 RepID=A0A6C0E978_9ZZZZ